MKFHAIIFDFDGTLIDSEKIHLQAYNEVFKENGFTIPHDEYYEKYVGLSDNEMYQKIFVDHALYYQQKDIDLFKKQKTEKYRTIVANSDFIPGVTHVKDFILSYSQVMDSFAICSNSKRAEVVLTLDKLENGLLKKFFKFVVTIDDVTQGKPSPDSYLLTAKHLNVSPVHCLVIEDTPTGTIAAKSAGMSVVAITTSYDASAFTNVDFIADNYYDIDKWIRREVVPRPS